MGRHETTMLKFLISHISLGYVRSRISSLNRVKHICRNSKRTEKIIMSQIGQTKMIPLKHQIGKLNEAVKLVQKPRSNNELQNYNKNMSKGLGMFNQLCLSANLTPDDKLDVIIAFIKAVPDSGQDMLSRWRDMIPFLREKELEDLIQLLVKITRSSDINSYQRMTTAMSLYNNCFLHICYECFADIACDQEVIIKYRIDAARYLFSTQIDDYKQLSQEILLEVIDTNEYPSKYRYEIIAGFISRTGINSIMNMKKLRVPYDEEFVYCLQTNFFYNLSNGKRERILSGQHILQMKCVEKEEKIEISSTLLKFAKDTNLIEYIRADAADVVLRLGVGDQKKKARRVIIDLGFSSVDKHTVGSGTFINRAKIIYNDSQNIHRFTNQVNKFIEKIINETSVIVKPYHEVHQEVSNLVKARISDKGKRFKAFKALNRISIDTARFTVHKITLSEIFVHVWIRIQKYPNKDRKELEKRMVEELVDMGDSCSTGHSGRFVNVLATRDASLKISWNEQIKANMAGRMNARIRDCPDPDLRGKLAMALSELAEKEDKCAYIKFIRIQLSELKKELYKEFVGEGYVTSKKFEKAFRLGMVDWV